MPTDEPRKPSPLTVNSAPRVNEWNTLRTLPSFLALKEDSQAPSILHQGKFNEDYKIY